MLTRLSTCMTIMSSAVSFEGHNFGLQVGLNHGPITTQILRTDEEKNQLCLRALKCPNSFAVKNQLKASKDKLLPQSIDWIHQDPNYRSWQDRDKAGLLWIKGGAGKGKTMMSIGIIEELSRSKEGHDESTVVTYFFCKYADSELNTLEAIVKGLILQLVNQQPALKESLRDRWDESGRFIEDVTAWRVLWGILLEMLERCKCRHIYLIVDALDECQDHNGMTEFLRHIVLNGLSLSAEMKWLLTSRPFHSAEQELFTGHDQFHISLDLNSTQASDAVDAYITSKVDELSCRYKYGTILKGQLEAELAAKAQGTFLWVSLVCKELEKLKNPHSTEVLSTIQHFPVGLYPFYDQMFDRIKTGDPNDVFKCMRLLQVMMLAYRPLTVQEIIRLTDLFDEHHDNPIISVVDRCASFIDMQENSIQFVHQSARDYLAGKDLDNDFGHGEIAHMCLLHLTNSLNHNLLDLQRPDSTKDSWKEVADRGQTTVLATLDYAASFWVQHLSNAGTTKEKDEVDTFLRTKFLEWLECLSWLDILPQALEALQILARVGKEFHLAPTLLQDARSFLLRHYQTINEWPLQIYSSAIIFSPKSSFVQEQNLDKMPRWIRKISPMEDTWTSLVRTIAGHSHRVCTIAFSPDGNTIASGSDDKTIKIWDATTGKCQETLHGHFNPVKILAFTPDGKMIISGSQDKTIKLWDTTTWRCQGTLRAHSHGVSGRTEAFSLIRNMIVSGFHSSKIKLWDCITFDYQEILDYRSSTVETLVFTPDGKTIASGSHNKSIKLWDAVIWECQKRRHEDIYRGVCTVAFSPDRNMIVSGLHSSTITLRDAITGDCQRKLNGHASDITALAFSPDGNMIASGSSDQTIKLWDSTSGDCLRTLCGHSNWVVTVAFSPDGNMIASGSHDHTIKLWDVTTRCCQDTLPANTSTLSSDGNITAPGSDKPDNIWHSMISGGQGPLAGPSSRVTAMAISPDARWIACAGVSRLLIWDAITGDLSKKKAAFHTITAVAFSPDGKQIVCGSTFGFLVLCHNATDDFYKFLDTGATHDGSTVRDVAFSPDGKQIASCSDGYVYIWDATTGGYLDMLYEKDGSLITSVAFSPDGKQIVCGSSNKIRIWDMTKVVKSSTQLSRTIWGRLMPRRGRESRESREIKTSEEIRRLKFSSDGRYLTTNIGPINIASGNRASGVREPIASEPLHDLYVRDQWICYGEVSLLRMPLDFQPKFYDAQGDQLIIVFMGGRVSSFCIDRKALLSIFDDCSKFS